MIKHEIEQAIKGALTALGVGEARFVVERPGEIEHGDYATNAALAASKLLKKNPKEVAVELVQKLEGKIAGVKKIEVAGIGFINFTISGMAVKDIVHEAHEARWGSNDLYKGKKIMVEYTDPNPFKEFHIGHLMSNAIGESIARILGVGGAQVTRANYQGDVGLHVAKTLWGEGLNLPDVGVIMATGYSNQPTAALLGKWYSIGSDAYEIDEKAKKEIDKINGFIYKILAGEKIDDPREVLISNLYEVGKRVSLAHFDDLYRELGTKFDTFFFESQTWQIGLELVKNNIGKVFEESEGAVVYKGEQDGLHTRVFLTRNGLTTYEAKDLGLLKLKEEAGDFDISITVTASEQKEYFKVVLAAAKKIEEVKDIANKTQHVTHGMMRFAEGKMSSRTGNVITAESLMNALEIVAINRGKGTDINNVKLRNDLKVAAVKYQILKSASSKDIIFDLEKSLSLEGDSGPYLQYALVRARSLLRKAADVEAVDPEPSGPGPLERLLIHFPEVVEHAASELEPHYVTTYLTEIAAAFNSWYAGERFIVDGKVSRRTVAVIQAVENTLAKGLHVLGIPAPEQM